MSKARYDVQELTETGSIGYNNPMTENRFRASTMGGRVLRTEQDVWETNHKTPVLLSTGEIAYVYESYIPSRPMAFRLPNGEQRSYNLDKWLPAIEIVVTDVSEWKFFEEED